MKTLIPVLSILVLVAGSQSQVTVTATTDTVKLVTLSKLNSAIATLNASIANLQAQITAISLPAFTTVVGDSAYYLGRDKKFHPTVVIQSRSGYLLADSSGTLVARGLFVGGKLDSVLTLPALRGFFSNSPGGFPAGVVVDSTLKLLKMK